MNAVEKRLAELLMTPDKYSAVDLHKIKNCLCFLRDNDIPEDSVKAERFLSEFVRRREADIPFDTKQLELECGINN